MKAVYVKDLEQHPEVDTHIQSWAWILAEHSDRLPFEFLHTVKEAFHRVRMYPELGHFVYKRFRRYNMKRFGHALIYREQGNVVYVIAVMHERRHPDYWKSRVDDASE